MSEGVRQRGAPKVNSGAVKPNSAADTKSEMARQGNTNE